MSQPDPQVQARTRAKRRNTAVALLFGLTLCLVGAFFAVQTLTGPGVREPAAAATIVPEPVAPGPSPDAPPPEPGATAAPAPVVTKGFLSPSGNIGCRISTLGARCDIVEKTWDPGAMPESCTGNWGPGVMVDAAGPAIVCATDSAVAPGPNLGYGETVTEGVFVCSSSEAGMRCENSETQQGFALSRRAYTFF